MSKKYILALPEAQAIIDVINDKGQIKRIVREIISALQGVHLALEAISAGEKLFEVWELRRKLNELKHPENAMNDATFIVLTTEERDFILAGTKRFDWTIGGKVNFWIRWEPFFTALANIKEYDEKNPPVEYVEWKRKWDADLAEINARMKSRSSVVRTMKVASFIAFSGCLSSLSLRRSSHTSNSFSPAEIASSARWTPCRALMISRTMRLICPLSLMTSMMAWASGRARMYFLDMLLSS
jgi:hypothetical protein